MSAPLPKPTAAVESVEAIADTAPSQVHGLRPLLSDSFHALFDVLAERPRQATGRFVNEGFRCALCSGEKARELFPEAIPESRGFRIARCERCGLVITHPAPRPDEIHEYYGSEYYGKENAKFGPLTEVFIFLFRLARLRALRQAGIRRGRILDLGCGRGLFLSVLSRAGYHVYGTELSESSARAARGIVGEDRIRVGPLGNAGFPAGQFDAVTAWQVFEHLADPVATLDECRRILCPGGVLILAVPNIESWQARWAGAAWFHLDVPRHLFHYSPQTLGGMLAKHGFLTERVSHFSLEQNPFGLLQSTLHRLGARYFGLYDLVRGPLDREERRRLRRLPGYASYLTVFPAAALVTYVGSFLRSGATFCLIARRV